MTAKVVGACLAGCIIFGALLVAAQAQDGPATQAARVATLLPADPPTGFKPTHSILGALIFSDEFNGLTIWNGKTGWTVTGGPQWSALGRVVPQGTEPFNNEWGWYLNPNYVPKTINPFGVAGGQLAIKATPYAQKTYFDLFPYTTGMITSYRSFRQLYGYFEIRARLSRGKGFLPAFWLLPADGSHAEIDGMEVLGSDPTKLYTTVHSYSTGKLVSTGKTTTIPDASKGVHTYGVDWQSDYITWYFDSQPIFKAKTPPDLHRPMYMIANVAVGGNWPGPPSVGSAAEIKIDSIRVYKFRKQKLLAAN